MPDYYFLSDGDIRYSSDHVKKSGKPFSAVSKTYNRWETIDWTNIGSWYEFKVRKLPLPKPEDAVAFSYIKNVGANHYKGFYYHPDLAKLKAAEKEEKRRKEILGLTKYAEEVLVKGYFRGRKLSFKEWFPHWEGLVEMVKIRLEGDTKEINDMVKALDRELDKKYDFTDPTKPYPNKDNADYRVYLKATKKRKIYEYPTRVAGVHVDDRQDLLAKMDDKTPLFLEREPSNPHDSNAVKVLAEINGKKEQIGYLHSSYAFDVAPLMDAGQPVVIENNGVITETFGDDSSGWHEYQQGGVRIKISYEDDVKI